MLLIVELAGAEVELQSEQVPLPVRHNKIPCATDGIGDELYNVGVDSDTRVAQGKEHVHTGADCAEKHADDPCADSIGGDIDIIVADNGADLFHRMLVVSPIQSQSGPPQDQ